MCSRYTLGAEVWPGLVKVQEEASEVVSAAAKVIAHPKGPESDKYRGHLEDEIGDVLAAIDVLCELNVIDLDRIEDRRADKYKTYTNRHFRRMAKRIEREATNV